MEQKSHLEHMQMNRKLILNKVNTCIVREEKREENNRQEPHRNGVKSEEVEARDPSKGKH